mmetsp:Transcript_25862/g.37863  ORF Transcript_25862/g.37863 Transcript_25862/m.37863 type:complete len:612 (-) Transcript_25862:104-1939(-)|eukprot:CAMPEP_0194033854 /NCGR_PEP_ID=MMETSP0009_2-20130614/6360_1 /TAXON_ID=210454 /ORGANISM="Grammatophora oceanica, Strain CCMP 410" /LENGTH=611 /DNA_ID=CAMNT_0038674583 /DNA_START=108 /DNA_END=1943 /DNA_ORIENTATION=+
MTSRAVAMMAAVGADRDIEGAGVARVGVVPPVRLRNARGLLRGGDRQSLTWSRVPLSPTTVTPPPRSGAASVVVKGRLYMFGGYGGGTGRLDDFYQYTFDTGTWEEVDVLGTERPGCRENNGVVVGDCSRVYLFGGYNGTSWLNDLWTFDIESKRWTCIQESSDPSNNVNQHHDQEAGAGAESDANNNNNNNMAVRGRVPSRRFGYVSVVHNNKFVLFGGFDGSNWMNDMHEFDFATRTWRAVQAGGRLPSIRSCPAWAKDSTHVYIQGGYDGVERKSDFFACDLATYTWSEMPCLGSPPSPRYFHSCCLYGSKMYLYGGYSGSERLADMYAYDFDTNHWSEVDCTNGEAPSGRSSLVAQVYENSLYVFGGYNGVTVLNDFYKFRLKPVSVPPPALVHDMKRLLNQPELSDVTFLVEGKEVYANRAILAVRSEYFRVMLFSGGMRESASSTNEAAAAPIEMQDITYPVFLKVLEYLYTDTVFDISLEIGIHLLIVSERYMLDRLKSLCEDVIRRDIHVDNVISILVASHQHNASGLKDIALEYILQHLSEPSIVMGLEELRAEPDLLVEIIKRSTLNPSAVNRGGQQSQQQQHEQQLGPFGNGSDWAARRQ